jgi:hypothetical protein
MRIRGLFRLWGLAEADVSLIVPVDDQFYLGAEYAR